jgi:hypothetical protein
MLQMCLHAFPFQFPLHEPLIVVLTCWSHCCSSSVSSSKCITASTCEPTENIWVNMVQITITYKGESIAEFFRLQHQIGYFKKKNLFKNLINGTPHPILINHPGCYLLSLSISKCWELQSNLENSKTYTGTRILSVVWYSWHNGFIYNAAFRCCTYNV